MKLYGYWRSSAAYRVRIALNLKGLAHEHVPVSLIANGTGAHQEAPYAALNPQKLVPALTLDDGIALTQSLAIMEYLDETHPAPPLLPSDPLEKAHVRALAQAIACDIHPVNNLRVLKRLANQFGADDGAKADWYRHWIELGFSGLETMLANRATQNGFCHGERAGLADCCLIPQVYNAHRFKVDMTPYPTIAKINENCLSLPAFQKAIPEAQIDAC